MTRAADSREDLRRAEILLASEKCRAENTMIVDLLRNDLSRVCTPHSVEVPGLCMLESYASVHHLVSIVTGELAEDQDAVSLLRACFPGSSITGAPKVRSMEIIAEMSAWPERFIAARLALSVSTGRLTRTLLSAPSRSHCVAVFQAGSGITAMSIPETECEETLAKAQRIFDAFDAERGVAFDPHHRQYCAIFSHAWRSNRSHSE